MSLLMPPELDGRGPTLATMHEIEEILRGADGPLSLNEIKRRMRAKAVPHATVRTVVNEFQRLGLATEGCKGVFWSFASDEAWHAGRHTKLV